MMVCNLNVLDGYTFVGKQGQKFNQVQVIQLWPTVHFLGQSRLCSQNLKAVSTAQVGIYGALTILFEKRGSSGFAERLIVEKTRMMSTKELSGADSAKSTKLYAIAASTVGSAERSR